MKVLRLIEVSSEWRDDGAAPETIVTCVTSLHVANDRVAEDVPEVFSGDLLLCPWRLRGTCVT